MNSQTLRQKTPIATIPKSLIDALTALSFKYGGLQRVPENEIENLQNKFPFTVTLFSPSEICGQAPNKKSRFLYLQPITDATSKDVAES